MFVLIRFMTGLLKKMLNFNNYVIILVYVNDFIVIMIVIIK